MTTLSRAEVEFRGWVRSLDLSTLTEHEQRLLDLILSNFAGLAPLGTAGARRATRIRELIEENRATPLTALVVPELDPSGAVFPVQQLQSLQIGPFRGFAKAETFDFSKPYVFVYGPNGSGKSSLCEGIEYALLGTIQEAEARRIKVSRYAKNITTETFAAPVLKAADAQGQTVDVVADQRLFGFCFIEKNRIEAFARMSATTPADQTARIASLFGLDEFNSFVEGFTDNFDNYLDLAGTKGSELAEKQAALQRHHATLESIPSRHDALAEEKAELLSKQGAATTYDELVAYLNGDATRNGRITDIDLILQQPLPSLLVLPTDETLLATAQKIRAALQQFRGLTKKLESAKTDVSFKDLYNAVLGVEAYSPDSCPACLTPLSQAKENPFDRARKKRNELKALAELESDIEKSWEAVVSTAREGIGTVSALNVVARAAGAGGDLEIPPAVREYTLPRSAPTLEGVALLADLVVPTSPAIARTKAAVTKRNCEIQSEVAKRSLLEQEKTALRGLADSVIEIRTKEGAVAADKALAEQAIQTFQLEQKALIESAAAEKGLIDDNRRYLSAYNSLLKRLKGYRDELPAQMVRNISDLTRDLYNAINVNDCEFDRLEALELPTTPGATISVIFCGDTAHTPQDALHVLSEGHLRCLGLAILLAKNVHQKCPFLIFDDVVNAIDDDHRTGIAELLCKHPACRDKQVILTTHGEEFVKTLSTQFCSDDYAQKVNAIDFVSVKDKREVVVNHSRSSRNFVARATDENSTNKHRDCLMSCRRAVENICYCLWRRLAKKYNAGILVLLRSPRSPPDLASLVDGLVKFLKKTVGLETNAAAKEISAHFAVLKEQQAWTYLNQGTHEVPDLPEFDSAIVKRVLDSTKALDDIVKTAGLPL